MPIGSMPMTRCLTTLTSCIVLQETRFELCSAAVELAYE